MEIKEDQHRFSTEALLPVYLLLDLSASMDGAPVDAMQGALSAFLRDLGKDSELAATVTIGFLSFGATAERITPGLSAPGQLEVPDLPTGGVTRLDLAFELLDETIQDDLTPLYIEGDSQIEPAGHATSFCAAEGSAATDPRSGGLRPVWMRPLVFVLTDGYPTDETGEPSNGAWTSARAALLDSRPGHLCPCEIVPVACGNDIDDLTLKAMGTGSYFRITGTVSSFADCFAHLRSLMTEWLRAEAEVISSSEGAMPYAHGELGYAADAVGRRTRSAPGTDIGGGSQYAQAARDASPSREPAHDLFCADLFADADAVTRLMSDNARKSV